MTNDLQGMAAGHCLYSLLCYATGGVVDDLIIYKQDKDKFLLVVNASNTDKDFQYLVKQAGSFKVELKNISDSTDFISLQGPEARKILQGICDQDLGQLDEDLVATGMSVLVVDALEIVDVDQDQCGAVPAGGSGQ